MRKLVLALCAMLICWAVLPAAVLGEAGQVDTMSDWNIRIAVPEGTTAALKGNEYYIYAQEADSIPYVMLRTYRHDDAVAFLNSFTAYMAEQYPDLTVTADIASREIGGRPCWEITYSYSISGYAVRDRRIALPAGGMLYVFTSKEIEALGLTLGDMLDEVVAGCEFIAESGAQRSELAPGYLYCREDGMPRYWLDFSGTLADNLVLHVYPGTGDAASGEHCLILDLSTAEVTANGLAIRHIRDLTGADCSGRFRALSLRFYLDGAVMDAERMAEDAEDWLPDGTFVMVPTGAAADGDGAGSHFRPLHDGPYRPEELTAWARLYCFRTTGFFPAAAEIAENANGTFSLLLTGDDGAQVRYTVDSFGEGTDAAGASISLMR